MDLSIVVPTYGRTSLCRRSLLSLGEALKRVPSFQCEVIVGVNGLDPETSTLLKDLAATPGVLKFTVMEFLEAQNPSAIRNHLVEKTRGKWVYFSDDDAYVVPEQRGSGMAQAMLERTEQWCRSHGIDLLLCTSST